MFPFVLEYQWRYSSQICYFQIFSYSLFSRSFLECIVPRKWHPSNVTEHKEFMLFGKSFEYFPFLTEKHYWYFQARIRLKTSFSASRYAIFAFRYSTVSWIGGLPQRDSTFFFLHFFHSLSQISHFSDTIFLHALMLSLGRKDVTIYDGNPSISKISRGDIYGLIESSIAFALHTYV